MTDLYTRLSLRDRLELLAFEAELASFPRSLILALWEGIDLLKCVSTSASVSDETPHPRRPE